MEYTHEPFWYKKGIKRLYSGSWSGMISCWTSMLMNFPSGSDEEWDWRSSMEKNKVALAGPPVINEMFMHQHCTDRVMLVSSIASDFLKADLDYKKGTLVLKNSEDKNTAVASFNLWAKFGRDFVVDTHSQFYKATEESYKNNNIQYKVDKDGNPDWSVVPVKWKTKGPHQSLYMYDLFSIIKRMKLKLTITGMRNDYAFKKQAIDKLIKIIPEVLKEPKLSIIKAYADYWWPSKKFYDLHIEPFLKDESWSTDLMSIDYENIDYEQYSWYDLSNQFITLVNKRFNHPQYVFDLAMYNDEGDYEQWKYGIRPKDQDFDYDSNDAWAREDRLAHLTQTRRIIKNPYMLVY